MNKKNHGAPMKTKSASPPPTIAPSVKAYEFQNKIIVKYYDDGMGESLTCPNCYWFGGLKASLTLTSKGYSEFECPECATKLALVSLVSAGEVEIPKTVS